MFFAPGKWMPISALNLLWLTDPHDLHDTPAPRFGNQAPPVGTHFLLGMCTRQQMPGFNWRGYVNTDSNQKASRYKYGLKVYRNHHKFGQP